jgi:transcriptional regulator with PAS, ATPase and Fis domain
MLQQLLPKAPARNPISVDQLRHKGSAIVQHPAEVQRRINKAAKRNCTVLVAGESGTGKKLVANEIHSRSARCSDPFILTDCTGLPEALFESLLFGHAKGAFTGADRASCGFFRAADGGTLVLDEIGELPLESQAKLLYCIQEKRVVPLGMHTGVAADVRVIAATNRDLPTMVRQGRFREDLYYRLNVVTIHLPPLRERSDEIVPLAQSFLSNLAATEDESRKSLTADAVAVLRAHAWPGNIRELANAIEHAFIMSDGLAIQADDLPETVRHDPGSSRQCGNTSTLAEIERAAVANALISTEGQKTRAAKMLGVTRQSLYRLIARYELLASA